MKKVLVLGGGFAGVEAAIALQKSGLFDVTLVSDRDYLYIYPISIWIPTRGIDMEKVKLPLSDIQSKYNFKLIIDTVQKISSKEQTVFCSSNSIDYDYLLIAIGANKMMHKGIEHTYSICGKPEMSIEIQKVLDDLITKGTGKIAIGFGGNPLDKSAVRGGPAFEFAFNVHNYLKKLHLRKAFQISFFAPMQNPGARMGEKAPEMINKMLGKANISQYYGKKIKQFEPQNIVFEDDSNVQADLIMFIAASSGHILLKESDLPLNDAGFIQIDDNCEVKNVPNVYAIGDVAALESNYDWIAKQGHIAELMAKNAVYNIIQKEKGSLKQKGYSKHLNILCIMDTGNGAAFVFRNHTRAFVIPMPIFGHWIKQAWGKYTKLTKTGKIPRMPGM